MQFREDPSLRHRDLGDVSSKATNCFEPHAYIQIIERNLNDHIFSQFLFPVKKNNFTQKLEVGTSIPRSCTFHATLTPRFAHCPTAHEA